MRVFELSERREHLTIEGLHKIIAIKASMNRGLSGKLNLAFPDVVAVVRPLVTNPQILDPHLLAGFTSGEGSFMVKLKASKTHSFGFRVQLEFVIIQHARDELLMKSLINLFECGSVSRDINAFIFSVSKLRDITGNIIPFFQKYPIEGVKALDFAD